MTAATRLFCPITMDERRITELTVSELEALIKRSVKKSVTEVMIEFAMEADMEAQVAYEAEFNDMLRSEMQSHGAIRNADLVITGKVDD